MLAIIFWNSRTSKTIENEYKSSLVEFHSALNQYKPKGFRYSITYRVESVPWFTPKHEIFEDWYVLSNFAALDVLDQFVLGEQCRKSHQFLMKNTAAATGGAFGLVKGMARIDRLPHVHWFSTFGGSNKEQFVDTIKEQLPESRFSFWTRAMGLGPKGYCLLTSSPLETDSRFHFVSTSRKVVWEPNMAAQK